ncbi:MAG: PAS domain S-box protein, partial [Bacteroidota bacterium]
MCLIIKSSFLTLEGKIKERTLQLSRANEKLEQDITIRKRIEEKLLWNKSFLELMANSSPLAFLVVDNRTDEILYFNHRFCQIWGIEQIEDQMQRGELKNNDIIPYCLPVLADIPAFAESCKPLQDEENRIILEDEIAFTENRTVRRFSTQIRGTKDEYYGRFYIFEEITERKRVSEFDAELLKLSVQLTGVPNAEIPIALNLALKKIGEFLGADRSYIFEMELANNTMDNTFEWRKEEIHPEIENLQNLPCNHLPRWWEKILKKENLILPDIQGLPETWLKEKEHLGQQGIQSIIACPMFFENELIGFVGLDSVTNKREYTISEVNNLNVWSNLLASLIHYKRKESIIEQTRQNYETFFNTIDDFLFILDSQGNIIHTNAMVPERLGYTSAELMGKPVLLVHPVERREEAGRIIGEMLAGSTEYCPVPLVTKSGAYIPVETRAKYGIWDGKPVIFGVTKDISKIKISEEKFSKAFHSNAALMAITRFEDGKLIDVNDKFITTLGYSREDLLGKSSSELMLYADSEIRDKIFKEISQFEPVRDLEIKVRAKSGMIRMGIFSADLIYIGEEPCLLTLMIDITERKNVEQALRESEARFSLFMDHLPALVFIKDNESRMIFANNAIDTALGASKWIGKSLFEFFDIETAGRIIDDDKKTLQYGYQKIEESFFTKDGTIHQYETQKFIIPVENQKPMLGGIAIDITERKLVEQQLKEARNLAEKANRAKSEFLSRM